MKQDSIPTGKLARSAVAGGAATKIGFKKLKLASKKPFLSEERFTNEKEKHDEEVAKDIFIALSKLRGTALKIAQIFSLESDILPEVYRRELYKSHYQAPPLNRAVIRKIIKAEFGAPPEKVFKEFEDEAFAAASLGQVHRALTERGERVTVKIQYPGIAKTVENDVKLIQSLLRRFVNSNYLEKITQEVELRLKEETDYRLEFQNTQTYRELYKEETSILTPRPFPELSSETVLTTTLIEGDHIDRFLENNPTQEERDHFGQLLFDQFIDSFFEKNFFHADPNPGNFVFEKSGKLGLVDFGCVKRVEPEFAKLVSDLWCGHVRRDERAIKDTYLSLGVRNSAAFDRLYDEHLRSFGEWLAKPLQFEAFDFAKHPDYCHQAPKFISESVMNKGLEGFTTENVFFDRCIYGIYRICSQLGAKVRFKNAWIHD